MSSSVKQQPISPTAYESFSNEFYRHRSSTASMDNDRLTPTMNNSTDSASTSAVLSHTNEPSRGPAGHDDKRHCAVCSDVASGYHYGVWSCEGCKAFFKRSIQGTNDYICPATNTCTIDKHRRKSCQACRLRRCYEVGMTKGTARRERKYRKKAVSVCKITSTSNVSKHPNKQDHLLSVSTSSARASTATPTGLPANTAGSTSLSSQQQQLQTGKSTSDSSRVPNSTIDFLATLSQASRLNLPAKIDPNRSLDDHYFLQLLAKIFDQELVVLINWAKAIPGYTENLTLDQQVTMIEQSWLDSLLLDVIERSLERNDDALQFAPDFVIPRNRELNSPILSSTCTYLFNILQAFKDPRTTHEEFLALKATMLINSIPASVSSTKAFRILTNQIYQTVYYTCDSNPSVYQDTYSRHFTLLLQLPHIKVLSLKLIRLFLEMRNNDLLPQADLLLEMLEAQDSIDVSFHMDVDAPPPPPPKNFAENPLATGNISPSSSFSIDNPSLYPPQFPGMSASSAQLLNLSQKRPSSTPSFSNYVETDIVSPSSVGHALKNSSSPSSTPPAQL